MQDLWTRLEAWLKQEAPEVLADLQPGASVQEIAELEAALQVRLPVDVKESLMIHNGQAGEAQGVIAGWELLSTHRIAEEWGVWKELYDSKAFAAWEVQSELGVVNTWWQPGWIPLTYNGAGDHHCIDLSPGDGGRTGRMVSLWHDGEQRVFLAGSFRVWFDYLVRTFEAHDGNFVFESGNVTFAAK